MRSALVTLAVLLCAALLWAALPATDTFDGVHDQELTAYSGSWTVPQGTFQVWNYEGETSIRHVVAGYGLARWNADSFADNQYAQSVVKYQGYEGYLGLAVRISTAGAVSGYLLRWNSATIRLGKLTTGTWAEFSNTTTPAQGSVMRLEANGTTIRALDDGVQILTVTDSSFTSGAAGICARDYQGTYFNGSRLDNWEGGDIAAAGTTVPPRRMIISSLRGGR